jgi:hypothetical protein
MNFDLKTGACLKAIQNAVPSSSVHMMLTGKRRLLCVHGKMPEPGQPSYLLYRQTLDGKLTGSIQGPAGHIITS